MSIEALLMGHVRGMDAELSKNVKSLWALMKVAPTDKRAELLISAVSVAGDNTAPTKAQIGSRVLLRAYFRCDGDLSKMDDAIELEVSNVMSSLTKMVKDVFK